MTLLAQEPNKRWEGSMLMPLAPAARVSHIVVCENGLVFIWNGRSQEVYFFTTDLKLPTPDKGQRSYRPANDEMVVSTFPYLSLSYHLHGKNQSAKILTESVSTVLAYGEETRNYFLTLLLALYGSFPVVSPGWEWACVYC